MKKHYEIVIVSPGMATGPNTLDFKSLGGSETSALMMAKELRKLGNIVTLFGVLPQPGQPDHVPEGFIGEDGVRYCSMEHYLTFITQTEIDLLVVSRYAQLAGIQHQARKVVLWCHDLATHYGPTQKLHEAGFNFNEIWCVSEFHRQQYHKVTGYPLDRIRATRNGCIEVDIPDWATLSSPRLLYYAARPERGLETLVRPGGIMSRLPEHKLFISMYDNFPEHMKDYYTHVFMMAKECPNVEILGSLKQDGVRAQLAGCGAYVYPTNFEETSCILAREAMSVGTPFITVDKGALRETLGSCGVFIDSHDYGSDEFCQRFADGIKNLTEDDEWRTELQLMMADRGDLYWPQVAEQWMEWIDPAPSTPYSHLWSLMEDSDIMAAIAYYNTIPHTPGVERLYSQIEQLYPYLFGRECLADYYERYFVREDGKGARQHRSMAGNPRYQAIAERVSTTPETGHVLDYGCAEGVIILTLATQFPGRKFTGIDHAGSNIALCKKYAKELELTNVEFYEGSTELWPHALKDVVFNGAIISEVLEHVEEPWALTQFIEQRVEPGGTVIITVPAGPWEALGLYDKEQWRWRAHIWHINKWMLRQMFGDKQDCFMRSLPNGHNKEFRSIGHLVFSYIADHAPVHSIDPLEKAQRHRARQTVTACIIAGPGSERSFGQLLHSLGNQVQAIRVAVADTPDNLPVQDMLWEYSKSHPWVWVEFVDVPMIEVNKFGFDDARNSSVQNVESDFVLWVDTDEYLSGNLSKYVRDNAFDSYAIHQHHFTCDPRGTPTQIDKPSRLYRTDRGFKFYGKVHEHAEKGENNGPGFCMVLSDVDIGHVGYANEPVRRDRFSRNFPFLEWDHNSNPDRKLGKYLWLRDIVQRARYLLEMKQVDDARLLAAEAISFYKEHWANWDAAGMGGLNSLSYYSEALTMLGLGLPVQIQLQVNDQAIPLAGVFEQPEQVLDAISCLIKPLFEKRNSGYWS